MQFIDLKTQYAKIQTDIQKELSSVLESCQFIMGPTVTECEKNLQNYTGSKHAISCSSGTDALIMALMSQNIKAGDEVIIPSFSFFATAEAVSLVGATPVFVDIEDQTFNIDLNLIEKSITKKTKAILYVSLYGQMPDVDKIHGICKKHNIVSIEDGAQSFGASYKGKKSCSISDISCTSFFPAKPLGCYGDGGAVFTNDDEIAENLKQIRNHGQSERYVHDRLGINGRMDSLQCAVINVKLKTFPWEVEQRRRLGSMYTKGLTPLKDKIIPPIQLEDHGHIYGQYTVKVNQRDTFVSILKENNVTEFRIIATTSTYDLSMDTRGAFSGYSGSVRDIIANAGDNVDVSGIEVSTFPWPIDPNCHVQALTSKTTQQVSDWVSFQTMKTIVPPTIHPLGLGVIRTIPSRIVSVMCPMTHPQVGRPMGLLPGG